MYALNDVRGKSLKLPEVEGITNAGEALSTPRYSFTSPQG